MAPYDKTFFPHHTVPLCERTHVNHTHDSAIFLFNGTCILFKIKETKEAGYLAKLNHLIYSCAKHANISEKNVPSCKMTHVGSIRDYVNSSYSGTARW